MTKTHDAPRAEKRIPMAVAVHIAGHALMPGVETTFTENVSSRGAKVLSFRRWRPDERLRFSTITGNFHALARVAWCQPAQVEGFALGLEFLDLSGDWVVGPGAPVAAEGLRLS